MSLFTEIQTDDRYAPRFKLAEGATLPDLFDRWELRKYKDVGGPWDCSPLLWCNLNGFFHENNHLYLEPKAALSEVIESLSIYGRPQYKDVYLKVEERADGAIWLYMQFQQIVGSYVICALPSAFHDQLMGMHYTSQTAGVVELPTLDGCEE